jgi:hypothetical protein
MNDEQRLQYFGDCFSSFPHFFRILPGEEVSIASAVGICNTILNTNRIPVLQINSQNSGTLKRKFVPLRAIPAKSPKAAVL